ncbi:MAG: hypothetical protein ACLUE1_01635 [Adlercreutzia equolifaciens]
MTGEEIARAQGRHRRRLQDAVTQGKSGGYYVFLVPVAAELDLKKAAAAAGEGHRHDQGPRFCRSPAMCTAAARPSA